jgi:hypothetical protein
MYVCTNVCTFARFGFFQTDILEFIYKGDVQVLIYLPKKFSAKFLSLVYAKKFTRDRSLLCKCV